MLGQKEGGVLFPPRSHDATPIGHLADLNNTICGENSKLNACRAAATAFRSLTLVIVLSVEQCDRIRLHAVAHIVQDPQWLARKRCGVPFSAAATTAFPSATPPILSTSCAVGTQHSRLGKSSVETCAPKPLARTNVNVSRDNPYCQPDCALRFSRPILRESACAIPNARALGYSWRLFSELIACESAACFVHVHHCAMRRFVSSLFPFARKRFCFLFGSLMVLLGSTFFCVFIVPCHQDRLCPPRCLSRRQRPCVLKGVLQMATSFAVCSFPRCIHAPWVWSLIVSVRSSWSLEICPLEYVISFFAMLRVSLSRSHVPPSRWVQPVPVFPFCLRVLSWAVPGQVNMRNCLARLRHIWGDKMSHRRRELRLHRASHLWASALACTKALSECRPTKVPRTSLCDVVGCNKAAYPLSLATMATPGTTSNLHGSSMASGLSCSLCLSRFDRGMSVDLSGVS